MQGKAPSIAELKKVDLSHFSEDEEKTFWLSQIAIQLAAIGEALEILCSR